MDQDIWSPGTVYPDAGSHTVNLPFSFQLPDNLPPSFHFSAFGRRGAISYSIEVVGKRPGIQRNRRIGRVFPIVPAATHPQVEASRLLADGWSEHWKKINAEDNVRQGLWGSYSRVEIAVGPTFLLPIYGKADKLNKISWRFQTCRHFLSQ